MKLRSRFILSFGGMAAITLALAILAIVAVRSLSSSLYEVGAVRLPSIQGLNQMELAIDAIDASVSRVLLTPRSTVLLNLEVARQADAWHLFDAGWNTYAPLPQTTEEAKLWKRFVQLSQHWRRELTAAESALAAKEFGPQAETLEPERQLKEAVAQPESETLSILRQITALNYEIAENVKRTSVASHADEVRVIAVVAAAAAAAILGGLIFALQMSREMSRPIEAFVDAFARIAGGDRSVPIPVSATVEISHMASALRLMTEALRDADNQLRLLSDNLPNCMVYRLVREPTGQIRIQHVSAAVAHLHGVSAESALLDSGLLYRQIIAEDRYQLAVELERSLAGMSLLHAVVRVRLPDGSRRWRTLCSMPRRETSGLVVWEGFEIDITDQRLAEIEKEKFARAIDACGDGAYLVDATNRIVYVNESYSRTIGRNRRDLVGQHRSVLAPEEQPEEVDGHWRKLRAHHTVARRAVQRRPDQSPIEVELSSTYVCIEADEFECCFARELGASAPSDPKLIAELEGLQRWQQITLEREGRVEELKREVNALCVQAGRTARYGSQV